MLATGVRADPPPKVPMPPGDVGWISLVDPDPDQVDDLHIRLGVPRTFVQHALDVDELPRIEKEGTTTLIVLRVPFFQGTSAAIPYITMPLGIVLTEHSIIAICARSIDLLHAHGVRDADDVTTAHAARIVLRMLARAAECYLGYLREINAAVDLLEARLHHSLRNHEVLALLRYQKSLTHFTTGLELNEIMLERLQQDALLQQHPEDAELLADVLTEIRQAIAVTSVASGILSQMMDAFASIISNNLNVVMKLLAAITIVLTIPTMIASFYGMNVALPGQHAAAAFAMLVALSLGITLAVTVVFWKKDWL